jgi:DNA-binding MarR family transcriptional regulator
MDSAIIPNAPAIHERLEALLVEVNGLANRLKSTDPTASLPNASRAALQLLQRCGPQTVPQLARARFSSRQNIQILINRLQQEGLVEFFTNPDHKRSALVRLTNRGQATIAEAGKELSELNKKILPSFSPSELSYATEVLNKLRKLFEGRAKPEHPEKETRSGAQSEKHVERKPSKTETTNEKHVSELASSNSSDDGQFPVSLL